MRKPQTRTLLLATAALTSAAVAVCSLPEPAAADDSYRPAPPDRSTSRDSSRDSSRGSERSVEGASPRGPQGRADVFKEPEFRSSYEQFEPETREPVPDSTHPASPIPNQPPPGVRRRDKI